MSDTLRELAKPFPRHLIHTNPSGGGLPQRFWDKVRIEGDCWVWTGNKLPRGYGVMGVGSKTDGSRRNAYVHRLSYEAFIGPIPDGYSIDHLCVNPPCVNPAHLEAVTPAENALRGQSPNAINARKTHCHRGHPFDDENTYVNPRGERNCRRCRADASARSRRRRGAAS